MNLSAASQQAPKQNQSDPPVDVLQLALRDVLSNLNVSLDHELARYRHVKRGGTHPAAAPSPFRPRQRRSLELAQVHGQGTSSLPTGVDAADLPTPPPMPPNPRVQVGTGQAHDLDPRTATPQGFDCAGSSSPPTQGVSPEVAALRSSLVPQPTSDSKKTYMASSEALLESLGGVASPPPASQTPQASWTQHLGTPLGLGALLLLLIASVGFGFVLVNPVAVQHLVERTPLARLWPGQSPSEQDVSEGELAHQDGRNGAEATDIESRKQPLNALSPDLSQQEFTALELNRLSTLPAQAIRGDSDSARVEDDETAAQASRQRQDEAAVEPSTPVTTTVPRSVVAAPQPRPTLNTPPISATPPQTSVPAAPLAPSSTSVEPVAPVAPENDSPSASSPATPPDESTVAATPLSSATTHYVVTDYTGDPSLEAARTAVNDAYVKNFDTGARIQLGVFSREDAASDLVENLQQQGIDARVYTP